MQALSGLKLKVRKVVKEQSRVSYAAAATTSRRVKSPSPQLYHNTTALPGIPWLRLNLTSTTPLESMGKLLSFPSQRPTSDPIPELVALTTRPIVLEEGEIEIPKH
jgi:hypothetical protein